MRTRRSRSRVSSAGQLAASRTKLSCSMTGSDWATAASGHDRAAAAAHEYPLDLRGRDRSLDRECKEGSSLAALHLLMILRIDVAWRPLGNWSRYFWASSVACSVRPARRSDSTSRDHASRARGPPGARLRERWKAAA